MKKPAVWFIDSVGKAVTACASSQTKQPAGWVLGLGNQNPVIEVG
ncbi:MAG TPA: hypothetical protein VHP99_19575 [Pyrinomonadaceae bacterium]|nr:hypothetical protein [Pyrinomonadaceae bacterium]